MRETRRDTGKVLMQWVPDELGEQVSDIEALPASGGEADLFRAKDAQGHDVVAKVYRYGVEPNREVAERIRSSTSPRLVRTRAAGTGSDGRQWEILEHIAGGDLREAMSDPELDPFAVARQLCDALDLLHGMNIEHRDVKPENVLVRSREPLDIALADYGVSCVVESSMRFTANAGTLRYAPPEAIGAAGGRSAVVAGAWDCWSLGMMVTEMLARGHPLDHADDAGIGFRLAVGDSDELTAAVANPKWRTLCRGLMRRDPAKRWGTSEVRRWLEDPDDLALKVAEDDPGRWIAGTAIIDQGGKIRGLAGLRELANDEPDKFTNLMARRRNDIIVWLVDNGHDDIVERLAQVHRHQGEAEFGTYTDFANAEAEAIGAAKRPEVIPSAWQIEHTIRGAARGDPTNARELGQMLVRNLLRRKGEGEHARRKIDVQWRRIVAKYANRWQLTRVDAVAKGTEIAEESALGSRRREPARIAERWNEIVHGIGQAGKAGEGPNDIERLLALGWVINTPGTRIKVAVRGRTWGIDAAAQMRWHDLLRRTGSREATAVMVAASRMGEEAAWSIGHRVPRGVEPFAGAERCRLERAVRAIGSEAVRQTARNAIGVFRSTGTNEKRTTRLREMEAEAGRERKTRGNIARFAASAEDGDEYATIVLAVMHREGVDDPETQQRWTSAIGRYRERWDVKRVSMHERGAAIAGAVLHRAGVLDDESIASRWHENRRRSTSSWSDNGDAAMLAWILNVPGVRARTWRSRVGRIGRTEAEPCRAGAYARSRGKFAYLEQMERESRTPGEEIRSTPLGTVVNTASRQEDELVAALLDRYRSTGERLGIMEQTA